jgi:hypothetical protein
VDHAPDPAVVVARAILAYDELVSLAEGVDEEWSYVQDLAGTWRTELERAEVLTATPAAVAAVDRLIDEIGRIGDPHRAIDWLSTFPQAVLLAVGGDPWDTGS